MLERTEQIGENLFEKIKEKKLISLTPNKQELNIFCKQALLYLNTIDENLQNTVYEQDLTNKTFGQFLLNSTFKDFYTEQNKSKIDKKTFDHNANSAVDLAIFSKDKENPKVNILFEFKLPTNNNEKIIVNNLNKTAFHELILYYLLETQEYNNNQVQKLIASDFYTFIVFENIREIEKLVSKKCEGSSLINEFKLFRENRSIAKTNTEFYNKIIKKYISEYLIEEINNLTITCIDLRKYKNLFQKYQEKPDELIKDEEKALFNLFRYLSPYYLLNISYSKDTNELDENFYKELLYIMGLKEVSTGLDENDKVKGLMGLVVEKIKSDDYKKSQIIKLNPLLTEKDAIFESSLELVITWINRIIFIKLLESQLKSYQVKQNNEYSILTTDNIKIWSDFDTLFFKVLNQKDREEVPYKFKNIPYLNSSLFFKSPLESSFVSIENLPNDYFINVLSNSKVKDKIQNLVMKNGKLSLLNYLICFLNSYDFALSEGEKREGLINASVLGLIFEKLNNYKDGSFYTRGIITEYMSREALELTITNKFNEEKPFEQTFNNYQEIKEYFEKRLSDEIRKKASDLIDSLKICDPAVGSGHFLVSVLNQILAIKSELDILFDIEKKKIPQRELKIEVNNDRLELLDEYKAFEYKVEEENNKKIPARQAQRIQKAIFYQKKTIIENCLFGVDINPKSAYICRLRLWIELLKNAYWKEESNYFELETLPNIDINIKSGNSLISKFNLREKYNINSEKGKIIEEYKNLVAKYKNLLSPEDKTKIIERIISIKNTFIEEFNANSPLVKKLNRRVVELAKRERQIIEEETKIKLLGEAFEKEANKNIKNLKANIQIINKEIEETKIEIEKEKNQEIYKNSFEWRFEFPEALDLEGNFTGFDLIIGNPPYIMEYQNKSAFEGLRDKAGYQDKADIWHIFTCTSTNLVKNKGIVSFIAKNHWLESRSASEMRAFIYKNTKIHLITDLGANMVFDSASVQTMVFLLQRDNSEIDHKIEYAKFQKRLTKTQLSEIFSSKSNWKNLEEIKSLSKIIPIDYDPKANLTFANVLEEDLLKKIESKKNFEFNDKEIIQGIIGGPDEAFMVQKDDLKNFTAKEKVYLKMFHTHTDKYYTPDSDKYILYLSRHNFNPENIENYPNIKKHFEPYKDNLIERKIQYGTPNKPYFYLHRERDEKFLKEGEKLAWAKRTEGARFTITNKSFYGSANLFFIQSERINLKYLTALLNSKSFYFYMHNKLKHTGDLLQIDKNQFMKIPLFKVTNNKQEKQIVDLVEKIILLKEQNKDTKKLEEKIDKLVYELYGLEKTDIAEIENWYKRKYPNLCKEAIIEESSK